jgi:hypothetical protein
MKPLEAYLLKYELAHLELRELSFGELQTMLRSSEITSEIYDHLATLSSIRDSGLCMVRTKLNRSMFNNLVFLDGFPTTEIIQQGRTIFRVTKYVSETYPTEQNLESLFSSSHWFDAAKLIYEDFDYDKFGPLVLAAPTINSEVSQGQLYIKDGCHRALALGMKMNNESFEYKEVDAVIVYFNRDKYDNLL